MEDLTGAHMWTNRKQNKKIWHFHINQQFNPNLNVMFILYIYVITLTMHNSCISEMLYTCVWCPGIASCVTVTAVCNLELDRK